MFITNFNKNNGVSIWDLFDRHFDDVDNSTWRRNIVPHKEEENSYSYFLNLAGFKKEDVDAMITDGVVSVKAKNSVGATADYSFYVPEDADADKMSANLEDGLLTITFEKEDDVKPKKIKIK